RSFEAIVRLSHPLARSVQNSDRGSRFDRSSARRTARDTVSDPRGIVTYTAYSKKPVTHQLTNIGSTAFHNIVITFPETRPRRFAPAPREVVGYTQVLDNERIRAWRLVLEPGQSAGLISQQAPGMRVIVQGGEIVESVPGECERGMLLRLGDLYWQGGRGKQAAREVGTSV